MELPKEMIQAYLKRRETDLEILSSALASNKVEEFNRIGHQLLGNAKSYGFHGLEIIADEMENLKLNQLATKGPEFIFKLKQWLENPT